MQPTSLFSELAFAALAGEVHLLLLLAEAQAILIAARRVAMRTGDAGLVERRGDFFGGQRMAAGAAKLVLAFQRVSKV